MAEQGFQNPVHDAQRVFRTLLTALSEPARILPLEPCCTPPAALDPAAASVILALCDGDTPLWLSPRFAGAADFFRFHTGAPLVGDPGAALFALADASERPSLSLLSPGTADYPDRAATLVLAVDRIEGYRGWRFSGPGIAGRRMMLAGPLDAAFAEEWRQNRQRFPLGVDVLFTAGNQVAGLPRGTMMEA